VKGVHRVLNINPGGSLPIFYSFRRCPYAIRSRLALCYSQTKVQLREVLLKDKPPCLRKFSTKATVPVLVLNDNSVIDESLDIIRWALRGNDPNGWLVGLSLSQATEANKLIAVNDGAFKFSLDRYKYSDRHPEKSREGYRDEAIEFLQALDHRLSHQQYLISDQLSIADVAIFPFIRQFAFVDKAWFDNNPNKHLRQWLNNHLSSSLFDQCMTKFPVWKKNDKTLIFP
jgi:glutathione S-transferase